MIKKSQTTTEYDGSTPLKSIMQEMFIDNLLKGLPQYEAYKQAGYKGKNESIVRSNSTHALTANNNIKARLAYKRAELAKRMEVTEESQVKRLRELSIGAQNNGQYSASVSAEDRINTLCGLYSKDNAQRGMSIVEILAIVGGNAAMPVIEGETGEQPLLEGTLP